jgi:hypothetical protein
VVVRWGVVRRRGREIGRGLLALAAVAVLVACGLDVLGVPEADLDPPRDASDPPTDTPTERRLDELDAGSEASACVSDGGFCDPCDTTLLLCLPFDGTITDESRHRQGVVVSGTPAFVGGRNDEAVALDGQAAIVVPHGLPWREYAALTIELWLRRPALPRDGGRAGLVDKNGSFGFFLQANGDLTCTPGSARRSLGDAAAWTHVACVAAGPTTMLYARGVEIGRADATAPAPSDAGLAVGSNSPSGSPLVAEVDGLRIYARAKSEAEIAASANASADAASE